MKKWTRLKYQPNLPLEEGKGRVTESQLHRELSMEAAKEGMVLLKNEGAVLPLKKGSRIALLGKGTFDYVKGGGGSGDVTVSYIHNLYDGLKQQGESVFIEPETAKFYQKYVKDRYAAGGRAGMLEEPELSEDPFLTGHQAAAMVRGVQSRHIAATVKHFAFNNKETNRVYSDSRVSERAAREIYLKVFEIVVKEAKVWAVMTSYNKVNGIYTSENADLLRGILREEWRFEGLVMTDWWNRGEQYLEILAGNDLKMGRGYPKRLLEAIKRGAITKKELKISAKRILELLLKLD